jgi:hypothetical protein
MTHAMFDDLGRHAAVTRTRRSALVIMLGATLGQLTTHSAAARENNRLKAHPACADGRCLHKPDCLSDDDCVRGRCDDGRCRSPWFPPE